MNSGEPIKRALYTQHDNKEINCGLIFFVLFFQKSKIEQKNLFQNIFLGRIGARA